MKLNYDLKTERVSHVTFVLVALILAIVVFGTYFLVRWLMGRW